MQGSDIDFVSNPVKFQSLIRMFDQLGFFGSINHSRILAYLLASSKGRSAKEICLDLGLPNSKVYSALNSLIEMGLINSTNNRPKEYLVSNTRTIEQFLDGFLEEDFRKKRSMVEEIHALIDQIWSPEMPSLDQVAYIYKGRELYRQIGRMISSAKEKIFFLLGDQPEVLTGVFAKALGRISPTITIDAAIPEGNGGLKTVLTRFEQKRLKQSVWIGNSYLVIDGQIMLSITHPHEVGLLTNDPLLVNHICNCWSDQKCCR